MNPAPRTSTADPLAEFLRAHWERRPGTSVGSNPATDDASLLFRAMCAAGRRARLGDAGVEFVIWLDGGKVAFDGDFCPRPGDGSLRGYLDRLIARHPETPFTVLLADPHLYDRDLWERARIWTRRVAGEVGMPNGGVDTCAFVGCYDRTPFGVHRGQMSVLTLPVIGRKRFLLWPYEYGHQHPGLQDSLDYSEHLEQATVEQSDPGDLLYWPADFWHIADAPRHASAAWNLGFWWDRPPLSRVLDATAEVLAQDGRLSESDPVMFDWNPAEIDGPLEEALGQFQEVSTSGALEQVLAIQWARFTSADGFRNVPQVTSPIRPTSDLVRMSGRIVVCRLNDMRLCLAANGHVILLDECRDRTAAWLDRLLGGEAVSVGDIDDDQVLAFLAATRALSPADAREQPVAEAPALGGSSA